MNKASFSDRFRYWFDNSISRGPIIIISWLAVITIIMVLLSSIFVWFVSADKEGTFLEQIWSFSVLALEPDAITFGHWPLRLATLIIVFTSIFALSTLIGVLTTGLESKLEELRKGRSRVIETNHTVLFGWSEHVFPVISELVIANENQKDSCIVILGDHDKIEMEDMIRDRVGDTKNARIICRHGDPMEIDDLQIASINTAKSIVILPPREIEYADSSVIKTLLAITRNPDRRPEPYHITAAIHDPKNLDVAKIVGGDEVELVCKKSLISRIVAQTCRQPGLSDVYRELLDFQGDEVYFHSEPALNGKTYQEALSSFEQSTVIGLMAKGAAAMLNPPMDTVIQPGDQIIAISADDDTIHYSPTNEQAILKEAIQPGNAEPNHEEHALILGWNQIGPHILNELDNYVPDGSSVSIVSNFGEADIEAHNKFDQFKNQTCSFQQGEITDRDLLDTLPLENFDHVILLANSDRLTPRKADARTLVTLLHLRDIADKNGHNFSIISEVLDARNRDLAEAARVDDFIVSDRLISLMLSQISENKSLGEVFEDMLNADGAEIYLKSASQYVQLGIDINYSTIITAASQRGETALGYRLDANKDLPGDGVVVNPQKSSKVSFGENDKIIVLADE